MNQTPQSNRTHIGIFGKRNAGKSSLLNAILEQKIALVSEIGGTTTDPVKKAMELLPYGPVLFIDTAGLDDEGTLGTLRSNRSLEMFTQIDFAILVHPSDDIDLDFEKNILKNVKSEVGIFIDASFPSRATTITNYIQGVVLNLASELNLQSSNTITLNNRNLFNQALRDEEMIVPGLLGLVLLVSPAILTALLVAKEKEKGTIFNFYSSSVTKVEFVIAKLSAVFALASLNIFLLFLLVIYLFDLPFRGSFLLYIVSSEIYIFISLSIGFVISILVSSQIVAVIVTLLMTILPGFLYSGMLMPISSMGSEAYIIAHIYPVMYYNHIIYDVFLIGQGFDSSKIVFYLGLLIAYAIGFFILSISLLKKEIR